ncbi:uncharacterized protein B0H18DRAFT_991409 [Fomitopsis serialis]|uniref:uncharacterized protein n=1 Tax=Fomitopsis serialis TaxID=139415 RepID=UPI002007757B|nr:uncharacterized protein B0H18DRAFT_991409 [Neoantrodia serialis]KAH9931373.1 hypothetical protein B0H18DRAFT_991409 [Neoantrodia serialis]
MPNSSCGADADVHIRNSASGGGSSLRTSPAATPPRLVRLPPHLRRKAAACTMDEDDSGWEADWEAESRASSVAPMRVEATGDGRHGPLRGHAGRKEGAQDVSMPMMAHPPMARQEERRVTARVEEECLARRRRLESGPGTRPRLRRYNPDYLLAARRWHAQDRRGSAHSWSLSGATTELYAEGAPVCQHCLLSINSHPSPAHATSLPEADCITSLPTDPLSALASLSLPSPPPPNPNLSPADWETVYAHLAEHRATLAHLQRAAADAERAMLGAWALVEEVVMPVVRRQRAGLSAERCGV